MTRLLVIPLNIYTFIISLPVSSPLPLFSFGFISISCTISFLYSLPSSNGFFLLVLFVTFFFLPAFSFFRFLPFYFFLSYVFFFSVFVLSSFGYLRTWYSIMSQATGGLLEVNKTETAMVSRAPAHIHTDSRTNSFTHTSVKLSNSPQRASLPQGKMPQREKQRDGMFSLYPPRSFSFSPPPAVVLSSSLQCSTNMQSDQRVWGVRSEGQDGRVWKTR